MHKLIQSIKDWFNRPLVQPKHQHQWVDIKNEKMSTYPPGMNAKNSLPTRVEETYIQQCSECREIRSFKVRF